jgi:hypothetical protein
MTNSTAEFEQPVPVPPKRSSGRRRVILVCGVLVILGVAAMAVAAGDGDGGEVSVEASPRTDSPDTLPTGAAALDPQSVATTSTSLPVSTTGTPSSTTTTSAAASSSTTAPRVTTTTTTTIPARGAPFVTTQVIPDDNGVSLPAGGVVFPEKAGWTEWETTSLGYRIRVWTEPPVPVAGQPTQFHVSITAPDSCCRAIIDRTGGTLPDGTPASGEYSTCGHESDQPYATSVIYPEPGLTRFLVRAGNCEWTKAGWITGWIDVANATS